MYATIADRDHPDGDVTFAAEIHDLRADGHGGLEGWIAGDGLRRTVHAGPDDSWQITGELLPHVQAQLTGQDGNAFAILGTVRRALQAAGYPDLARCYMAEAMAGDYDHLLQTTMRYVTVS